MATKDKPELALTASGRTIELPRAAGGDPVVYGGSITAFREAQNWIRRGDLAEALVWLERAGLVGLTALIAQET
jgi:hypothetical protein